MPRVSGIYTLSELREHFTAEQWAKLKAGTAEIPVLANTVLHRRIDIPTELLARKVGGGKVSCFWRAWKDHRREELKVERVRVDPSDIWFIGSRNDLHREQEAEEAENSAQSA